MRRIKWLTRSGGQTIILVFSSWVTVLDVLSHALQENGINFMYARTPKQLEAALKAVQQAAKGKPVAARPNAKPLTTLLLPLKQGANGLNLTGTVAFPVHEIE